MSRQTDRHTHHSTLQPYSGKVKIPGHHFTNHQQMQYFCNIIYHLMKLAASFFIYYREYSFWHHRSSVNVTSRNGLAASAMCWLLSLLHVAVVKHGCTNLACIRYRYSHCVAYFCQVQ